MIGSQGKLLSARSGQGIDKWIIEVIMAMYSHCRSAVRVNGITGDAFDVMVGVHQGSVLRSVAIHHSDGSPL